SRKVPRVPGTAVFLTRAVRDTPPVLVWHLRHRRALHETVIALTSITESVPFLGDEQRIAVTELAPQLYRVVVRYGFTQRPDIPHIQEQLQVRGCASDLNDVAYFVGHETVTARADGKGLPRWREGLFDAMERNAAHDTDYFRLPPDQVVEIGRQIA